MFFDQYKKLFYYILKKSKKKGDRMLFLDVSSRVKAILSPFAQNPLVLTLIKVIL